MKTPLNWERDIEIDKHQLDREWVGHPTLFMRYSEASARANREKDEAKEKLDLVYAKVDRHVRKTATEKITETMVKNAVMEDPEYKTSLEEYREATYQATVLSSAVKAFDHRKTALESLVRLSLSSYYSSPKSPEIEDGKSYQEASLDQARDRQREKLNKKRRKK